MSSSGSVMKGVGPLLSEPFVLRNISFSVLILAISRRSFSFSPLSDVDWFCRLVNLASRSFTCLSLRSRNARCLPASQLTNRQRGMCTYAARFCAFLRLCCGVRKSFSSLLLLARAVIGSSGETSFGEILMLRWSCSAREMLCGGRALSVGETDRFGGGGWCDCDKKVFGS